MARRARDRVERNVGGGGARHEACAQAVTGSSGGDRSAGPPIAHGGIDSELESAREVDPDEPRLSAGRFGTACAPHEEAKDDGRYSDGPTARARVTKSRHCVFSMRDGTISLKFRHHSKT